MNERINAPAVMNKKRSEPNAAVLSSDLIVVGGGTAGLMAGILLKEKSPETDVLVLEKAHAKRSGCLAMGLNAVNLYLADNNIEDYVAYVRDDMAGVVRTDLVRSVGRKANRYISMLTEMGVPFPRDNHGGFVRRSPRSIAMRGEHIKPLLYEAALRAGVRIENHTNIVKLLQDNGNRVIGTAGYRIHTGRPVCCFGRAVLVTTGGASGIYRPSNPGTARKKTWYCPYNAGSGMAMGLRAGAEMTSFESRYIALRTKDLIAPTGTLALGTKSRQVNGRGEEYLKRAESLLGRKLTTCERLYYQMEENRNGRGPCMMDLTPLTDCQYGRLIENYLDMSPGLILQMLEDPEHPEKKVEVSGSEPYINGGHGMAGFWIDTNRRTTLSGLYAAGDTAGGAPKKYITGCFAEAETAVDDFLTAPPDMPQVRKTGTAEVFAPLCRKDGLPYTDAEERLQKIMDEYAGGYTMRYGTNREKLRIAARRLRSLEQKARGLSAPNLHELTRIHEVHDRILLARVLVKHMLARKETRWPGYQMRLDYPVRNDVEYRFFINSRMSGNRIEVFARGLEPPYRRREVPDAED